MKAWLAPLAQHRVVRASAAAIFLYGFAGAATSPYQSVIGIRELGLSNGEYAAMALLAAVANVVLSIGIGLISDHFKSYRRPLIFVSAFGVFGYGVIWLVPSPVTFVLAMIGPLALFHATNSMLFGNVRAYSDRFDPQEAQIVNAVMRMMISLSWVLVPGVVGLMMQGRASMIGAFAIAALLSAACLAVIIFWLEPDRPPPLGNLSRLPEGGTGTAAVAPSAGRVDRPAQVRLPRATFAGLGVLLTPQVALPILGVALISQVLHVNAAVLPLIITGAAGGTAGDIGLIVGMVAGLEVVFMFFWTAALSRISLTAALMISAFLYMVYFVGIAAADAMWLVWLSSVIGGFAAAGIISLPISYLLDLIRDKPGLSASLIAVNMFVGGAIGAGIFALGTALSGYGLAGVISGMAGVLGAGLLIMVERKAG